MLLDNRGRRSLGSLKETRGHALGEKEEPLRVGSSRWVRGLGLIKEPQPARPRGEKEARATSGLSVGHRLTFISCCETTKCLGDGSEKEWKSDAKWEEEIGMEIDGWCDCMWPGLVGPPLRKGTSDSINTDDFLLESDYPLEAEGEPYKSFLIKTGPFIDSLMSLGH